MIPSEAQRGGTEIQNSLSDVGTIFVCSGCPNKVPQAGGLNHKSLLPRRPGGQESEIKVSAALLPSGVRGFLLGTSFRSPLASARVLATLGTNIAHW